jgi:hypothetical protein
VLPNDKLTLVAVPVDAAQDKVRSLPKSFTPDQDRIWSLEKQQFMPFMYQIYTANHHHTMIWN